MNLREFENGEYYHIYNRGNDGRALFNERYDLDRFLLSMKLFNTKDSPGSVYEQSFNEDKTYRAELVEFIAYCLNPNHFHFLVQQKREGGISLFMQRLGGYVTYYNLRYKRKGGLLQGKFKAKLVDDNDYLLHLSAYVNLNARVHKLGAPSAKLSQSSWKEYVDPKFLKRNRLCKPDIILNQFASIKEYENFCEESLELMLNAKEEAKELKQLALEDF